MLKKLFFIGIFVLAFISCSKSENNNNISNTNDIAAITNTSNVYSNDINEEQQLFDMKYVYKAVRVNEENFTNALSSYYQDSYYTNIISRNKDFLNKKLVGDNDIKKYAIDFISNSYHNHYADDVSMADINSDDYTYYYASEYNYVEENLALKKARDLLLSINNKDADIYFALFLSHMAADSLYCFYDMQKYLKEWKNSGGTNINMMIGIVEDNNALGKIYSNKMNMINYIIYAPEDLRVEKLIADAYDLGFLNYISKNSGYLDIYNENNYNLSSIIYEGEEHLAYIVSVKDIVNTNIMDKYIRTYAKNTLTKDKLYSDVYYENFYNITNSFSGEKYNEFADLYFLEFNKNTFIYSIYKNKLKEVYYFNPKFIGNVKYASYKREETFNFRLGDDEKLTLAEISVIKKNELTNFVSISQFINDGKFNGEVYAEYLDEILSFPLYNPEFFLCDINNDGKDEIMLRGTYKDSEVKGGTASYTLLLKDNLELDLDSAAGKSINSSTKQGLNTFQKIYQEDSKNKMLLVDNKSNTAQDIFTEDSVVSVDEFTYKSYSFKPELLWKGAMNNGVPDKVLKTDAGFDMSKAESISDKAIVSDKTLRIADKLISDNYYKEREKLDKDGQEKLLDKRRSEIKSIQDKQGDILEIEKEMIKILGIDN